ncbi:MAG TPA: HEAT repeat domain-containing protein [Ktedonobacteraceae bacterium]
MRSNEYEQASGPRTEQSGSGGVPMEFLCKLYQRQERNARFESGEFSPEELARALQNAAWDIRVATLRGIRKRGEAALLSLVLPLLADKDPQVRAEAVRVLGKLGRPEEQFVREQLLKALRDREWWVREAALMALTALDQESRRALLSETAEQIGCLASDESQEVQDAARLLIAQLANDASPEVAAPRSISRFLVEPRPENIFLSPINTPAPGADPSMQAARSAFATEYALLAECTVIATIIPASAVEVSAIAEEGDEADLPLSAYEQPFDLGTSEAGQQMASLSSISKGRPITRRQVLQGLSVSVAASVLIGLGTLVGTRDLSALQSNMTGSDQHGSTIIKNRQQGSFVAQKGQPGAAPTRGPEKASASATARVGRIVTVYGKQAQQMSDARWSPDGKLIASASYDQSVQIWQALTGAYIFSYRGHKDQVKSLDWSPDGSMLISGGGALSAKGAHDYSVQIWRQPSGLVRTLSQPTAAVEVVRWSPDGAYIAAASADGKAYVWEATSGLLVEIYTGHQASLTGLAWSPDSKHLVTSSSDAAVQVWEATTGQLVTRYAGHQGEGAVLAVAWSPDGTRIATSANGAGRGAPVRIWRASTGQTLYAYTGHVNASTSSASALVSRRSMLPLAWKRESTASRAGVTALAWSPDSHAIASGGGTGDGSIQIWGPSSHREIAIFASTNGGMSINSLAWSRNGALLVSSSLNLATVRLMNG